MTARAGPPAQTPTPVLLARFRFRAVQTSCWMNMRIAAPVVAGERCAMGRGKRACPYTAASADEGEGEGEGEGEAAEPAEPQTAQFAFGPKQWWWFTSAPGQETLKKPHG